MSRTLDYCGLRVPSRAHRRWVRYGAGLSLMIVCGAVSVEAARQFLKGVALQRKLLNAMCLGAGGAHCGATPQESATLAVVAAIASIACGVGAIRAYNVAVAFPRQNGLR